MRKLQSVLVTILFVFVLIAAIPNVSHASNSKKSSQQVTVDREVRYISNKFSTDKIPDGFEKSTLQYNGKGITIVKSVNGNSDESEEESVNESIILVYLTDEKGKNGEFYRYYEEDQSFSKFLYLSSKNQYFIFTDPASTVKVPEGYTSTTLDINDMEIQAWKNEAATTDTENFYLIYGMNQNQTEGFYQYDTTDGSYQKFIAREEDTAELDQITTDKKTLQEEYVKLEDQYHADNALRFKIICGLIIFSAVLFILLINAWLRNRGLKRDLREREEDEVLPATREDLQEEPKITSQPEAKPVKEKSMKKKKKKQKQEEEYDLDEELKGFDAYDDDMVKKLEKEMIESLKISEEEAEKASAAVAKPESEVLPQESEPVQPTVQEAIPEPEQNDDAIFENYDDYDDFELEILDLDAEEEK